jgi:hypothetical protein
VQKKNRDKGKHQFLGFGKIIKIINSRKCEQEKQGYFKAGTAIMIMPRCKDEYEEEIKPICFCW